ncbi:hypothetical protein EQG63_12090 [Flavobacterium amnicola]|uniref:Uncharacterized protein n=1 Tax=Flavobacterium amnicola TaxID=2506422 RepID=A0A4Q1K0E5_9FLAO|nr:hypothetical protein [Flavobacterium amnicola]RXR15973.1 hypothetical protein EQG63_12090 [Flavobacterium amnicola]
MDSKEQFFEIISKYYGNIIDNEIPREFLIGMCMRVTDYYYNQYSRFHKQYPKSQKRYSTFDLKDIDHPSTLETVIKYFKEVDVNQYLYYSSITLKLTESEVKRFEKSREDFYNMF